jgi:CheY-like chemotaxis protein
MMHRYSIIIVENDEDEQMFMQLGFEEAGLFDVLTMARSGEALLEWLQAHPEQHPQLILSDLNMPGKNGYDILAEMRANPRLAQIPVIITSTSTARSIMDKCLALGAADYVVKPDTFIEYAPFVRQLHRRISELGLIAQGQ